MKVCKAIIILFFLLPMPCCAVTRSAIHALKSTDHFMPLEADGWVLYEEGAERFAEEMATLLPGAIEKVEAGHCRPFAGTVTIHVCATEESYPRLTGLKAPASVTLKGVFFSPRLVRENRPISLYLAHELSHLHLEQQIGRYRSARLPAWFREGLATLVSDGGGAHTVSESEAAESIRQGIHFKPHEKGGILFRKYGQHWGLSTQMFYRQSMMFVAFVKEADEAGYREFLMGIQDGLRFADAFNRAFDLDLGQMWDLFVEGIKSTAGTENECLVRVLKNMRSENMERVL